MPWKNRSATVLTCRSTCRPIRCSRSTKRVVAESDRRKQYRPLTKFAAAASSRLRSKASVPGSPWAQTDSSFEVEDLVHTEHWP